GVGGGGRGDEDEVDIVAAHASVLEGRFGRADRQIGRHLSVRGDAPFANARALHDPLVGGVESFRQIAIGHDAARQIGTAACDDRARRHQRLAALTSGNGGGVRWAKASLIFSMAPWTTMSMATPIALAKPTASVPPWLFTAIPLRPRKMAPL